MAGLFNLPTPEAVRQSARDSLFKRSAAIATAPDSQRLLAAQGGGLLGQAVGEEFGTRNTDPEIEGIRAVQQATEKFVQDNGIDTTTPKGQFQMLSKASEFGRAAGIPRVYEAADKQALALKKQFQTNPTDKFAPILDMQGNVIAQRNLKTNKVVADPRAPKDPDTVINNNLGDQDELAKSISKQIGADIVENRTTATVAKKSLLQSNEAIELLNSGVITGTGAEYIKGAGKILSRLGFNEFEDDIKNTEAFAASMGNATLAILGSGALGAGTGISDNDRKFAKQIAGGEITLSEKAIRRIISINQKVSENVINTFNADLDKIPRSSLPFNLRIEMPEFDSPLQDTASPQTQEDFDAIPSGGLYIDPDDGQTYRKQ